MPAGDPPRPTSNDVLNRLDRFLRQQERDANEGITLRSVHNKVSGLQQRFEASDRELRERIARVEQNDRRDAEERAHAGNTGRFFIPPGGSSPAIPTPVQPIPVSPPPPAVEINVNGSGRRRDSRSPIGGVVVGWAKKAGGPLALAIGAWVAGRFGASQVPKAPASASAYELPAPPLPPPPLPPPAPPESHKLDAGFPGGSSARPGAPHSTN